MTPETAAPQISVLIPAYNEERLIGRTLDAVHASFAALPALTYEIVVCDNNSTDKTTEAALAKGARVVREPHNQIARARNTAAKNARGAWFIFLDADTFLTAKLLGDTVRAFEGGRICAGGTVLVFDREDIGWFPTFMCKLWNRVSVVLNLAAGAYLFCLREAWVESGGFSEEVYAGEELYFSRRMQQWGRKRKMKFKILSDSPITTSARKMEWYSSWGIFGHVLRMLVPGAMKKKEACDLWYSRPADAAKVNAER
ncbi:MAG TPA: glycosyltransferase [Chthoniobacteraceae bacterium]|nr:glycosyltransferase [Chthoniobacteraceae bacterium]